LSAVQEEPKAASRGVEAVARAVDLLEALSEEDCGTGLVELGRRTGLHPSTTHRLLATLRASGYVRRDPDSGRYALGYGALKLSATMEQRTVRLKQAAKPYLERVHAVSGKSVDLFALARTQVIRLDRVCDQEAAWPAGPTPPGQKLPAHATAAGCVMYAFGGEEALERTLNENYLGSFTPRTVTDRKTLMKRCADARDQGWAVCREELVDRVSCVAAPIFDDTGEAIAAICVSGQTRQLQRVAPAADLGELVGRAGMEASRDFGFGGESVWS
jgi:IclR family acetate operon transcriptional repressor